MTSKQPLQQTSITVALLILAFIPTRLAAQKARILAPRTGASQVETNLAKFEIKFQFVSIDCQGNDAQYPKVVSDLLENLAPEEIRVQGGTETRNPVPGILESGTFQELANGDDMTLAKSVGQAILTVTLDDHQVYSLMQYCKGDTRCSICQSPTVIANHGQPATVTTGALRTFVTGYSPVKDATGTTIDYEPEYQNFLDGISVNLLATQTGTEGTVQIQTTYLISQVESVRTISTTPLTANSDKPGYDVQIPVMDATHNTICGKVESGSTLLFDLGWSHKKRRVQSDIPFLQNVIKTKLRFKNVGHDGHAIVPVWNGVLITVRKLPD